MEQNRLYIPRSVADGLPALVKNELTRFSAQKQEEFVEEYQRRRKSLGIAYLLLFLFPVYYGYLKKWGMLVLYWFTGAGCGIWWFIDIFRLPGMVNNYNKDVAMDVMRHLVAISPHDKTATPPVKESTTYIEKTGSGNNLTTHKLAELEKIQSLLDKGTITQEEFERLKREILGL